MTERVFIIAEAGVNHDGKLATALRLVEVAAEAGADAVKFQTFSADRQVTRAASKAPYQKTTTDPQESQHDMLRRLELSADMHHALLAHCRTCGIDMMSTAFDIESVDLLVELGLQRFKIPSGEITNLPYLRHIGRLQKQVLLSTGMSTPDEIDAALLALAAAGTPRSAVTVLHCTSSYPAPIEEANLRAMQALAQRCGTRVGYSDHTPGIEVAVAAVALGACVIEKHFTLDRRLPGPDHQASLEPGELRALVRAIRHVELALGDGIKRVVPSEAPNRDIARKSLVAKRFIRQGEVFTADNVTAKRPGTGLSPMRWDEVMGSTARRDFSPDELLEP